MVLLELVDRQHVPWTNFVDKRGNPHQILCVAWKSIAQMNDVCNVGISVAQSFNRVRQRRRQIVVEEELQRCSKAYARRRCSNATAAFTILGVKP